MPRRGDDFKVSEKNVAVIDGLRGGYGPGYRIAKKTFEQYENADLRDPVAQPASNPGRARGASELPFVSPMMEDRCI
jgi:hypothetical protein